MNINNQKIETSVLMTTYNGEEFIYEQLKSICTQTVKPDEIIIVDDRSTDNTLVVAKRCFEDYKYKNFKIIINETNLGHANNFLTSLSYTCGNIIFLSDQDDIWESCKIEMMKKAMDDNSDILCLVSKRYYIDTNGQLIKKNQIPNNYEYRWPLAIKNDGSVAITKESSLATCMKAGHLMAIRSELISPAQFYINNTHLGHDGIISMLSYTLDGLYAIDKALISYRIHENNAVASIDRKIPLGGVAKDSKTRIDIIDNLGKTFGSIADILPKYFEENRIRYDIIEETSSFFAKRVKYMNERNLLGAIGNLKDIKHYWKYRNYLADIILISGLNEVIAKIKR